MSMDLSAMSMLNPVIDSKAESSSEEVSLDQREAKSHEPVRRARHEDSTRRQGDSGEPMEHRAFHVVLESPQPQSNRTRQEGARTRASGDLWSTHSAEI